MNEHISTGIEADEKDSTGTSLPESLLETQNDLYEEQKNSGQLEMKLMVAIEALRRVADMDDATCRLCSPGPDYASMVAARTGKHDSDCTTRIAREALEKIGE